MWLGGIVLLAIYFVFLFIKGYSNPTAAKREKDELNKAATSNHM